MYKYTICTIQMFKHIYKSKKKNIINQTYFAISKCFRILYFFIIFTYRFQNKIYTLKEN